MTDEAIEAVEEIIPEIVINKADEEAMGKGWKPKDQFEGKPEDWRDSKTFLEKGELLDAIHSLKKQTKENKEIIETLLQQQKHIADASYKKALADAQVKHREAVEVGDVDAAGKAAQELIDLSRKETPTVDDSIKEAVTEFARRNRDWFNQTSPENSAMSVYADRMEQQIRADNPHLDIRKILDLVEDDVKKKFSHKFRVVSPDVSAVSAPKAAPVVNKSTTISDLPRFQQIMIQKFRREVAGFDEAAYVKEIRSIMKKGDK